MARIKYIEHNGTEHEIDVANGLTVMEGAVQNGIPGIDADCGGSMSCATCHVVVDPEWYEKTGSPDADEEDMLDLAFGLEPTSRLGCQIRLDESLNGLKVRIPED